MRRSDSALQSQITGDSDSKEEKRIVQEGIVRAVKLFILKSCLRKLVSFPKNENEMTKRVDPKIGFHKELFVISGWRQMSMETESRVASDWADN